MTWWRSLHPVTRRVLAAIGVVVALNAALTLIEDVVGGSGPGGPSASSYATAPEGLAAYADLLGRHDHPVERLRDRLENAELPPGATVVVADPPELTPVDADALAGFVRRGGRLIVTGPLTAFVLQRLNASPPRWSPAGMTRAGVLAPARETAEVSDLRDDGTASWDGTGSLLPIAGDEDGAVAALGLAGGGRVIALADSALLSNRLLDDADNATFALNLAGERGRLIVFAEAPHGFGDGSGLDAIPDRWWWALAIAAAGTLTWMWARGRRLGPPEELTRALPPPRRAYVDAMATTMARTRDPAAAAEPLQGAARRILVARAGLPPDADDDDVRTAGQRLGLDEDEVNAVVRPAATDADLVAAARVGPHRRRTRMSDAGDGGQLRDLRDRVRTEVTKVVVGQEDVLDVLLAAAAVGGHVLLEGVPGVAKTLLANAVARALGLEFRRAQFTPDMLPSDLTGTMTLRGTKLEFRPGPVFTNLLLADEINRTPPKTQAALLEAMQERQVTVEGEPRALPDPFLVIATQNPIEYEGTYPLPEAQLDRFLVKVDVGYPDEADEVAMLQQRHRGVDPVGLDDVTAVAGPDDVLAARTEVDATSATDEVVAYVAAVVRRTRELPSVALGASPRAAVHLLAASRAAARLAGRSFVTPDDVAAMAPPVLRHRLLLRPEAELERYRPDDAVAAALAAVPVPR